MSDLDFDSFISLSEENETAQERKFSDAGLYIVTASLMNVKKNTFNFFGVSEEFQGMDRKYAFLNHREKKEQSDEYFKGFGMFIDYSVLSYIPESKIKKIADYEDLKSEWQQLNFDKTFKEFFQFRFEGYDRPFLSDKWDFKKANAASFQDHSAKIERIAKALKLETATQEHDSAPKIKRNIRENSEQFINMPAEIVQEIESAFDNQETVLLRVVETESEGKDGTKYANQYYNVFENNEQPIHDCIQAIIKQK